MNVHTAMHYLKSGCCIRRAAWKEGCYLVLEKSRHKENDCNILCCNDKMQVVRTDQMLGFVDLVAEDWELFHPPFISQ